MQSPISLASAKLLGEDTVGTALGGETPEQRKELFRMALAGELSGWVRGCKVGCERERG